MNITIIVGIPGSGKTEYIKKIIKGKKVYTTKNKEVYDDCSEVTLNGNEADYFIYDNCIEVEEDIIDFLGYLKGIENIDFPDIIVNLNGVEQNKYYKELFDLSDIIILKKMNVDMINTLSTLIHIDTVEYDLSITEMLSFNENYKLTKDSFELEK